MAEFRYSAIDAAGEKTSGSLTADTISDAAAILRKRGYSITELAEDAGERDGAAGGPPKMDFLTAVSRVGNHDIVLLFRQLASLSGAGVTLIEALRILESQADKRRLRYILTHIRHKVEEGNPIGEAMCQFPRIFPHEVTSIIKAGEMSGMMEDALERIAIQLEEKAAFRAQVIGALIYPSIVFVAAIGVTAFLVGFVIPKIVPFLLARGGKLPWNTQFLIDLSDYFRAHGRMLAMGTAGAVVALIAIYRIPPARLRIDLWKMHLPVFGPIFRMIPIVQFSKTVSALLESGILMIDSLEASRSTVSNAAVRRAIDTMIESVMSGESLSVPIERSKHIFPRLVGSVVKVGEETGGMAGALTLVADIYSKTLQGKLKRLTTMIEPCLTVFLGIIVGFVAWSMIAGMLSMYGK